MIVQAKSASQLLGRLSTNILRQGNYTDSRAGRVLEMPGATMLVMQDPHHSMALNRHRRLNPWVSLAEFPWLMAGRNDVAWLLPYLPKAGQFSDDGKTWRAGYGPRLRMWPDPHPEGRYREPVDQLQRVVDLLRNEPATRQAAISIWDPRRDWVDSKDIPCTLSLSFMPRAGQLDLLVTMRSNDIVWGLTGVNMVNFTGLLQVVAACAGMGLGQYTHVAHNLHVYERHWPMIRRISREAIGERPLDRPFTWVGPAGREVELERYSDHCDTALELAAELREDPPDPYRDDQWYANMSGISLDSPYAPLAKWLRFMVLWAYRDDPAVMSTISVAPWRDAAMAYAERRQAE